MIKIEVFYKDADQAPEYFEVNQVDQHYFIEDGVFQVVNRNPYKVKAVPLNNIHSIEIEEFEKDE